MEPMLTRDRFLEAQADAAFRDLFGSEALFYSHVYEAPGQHEHDLIVSWRRYLFVIEAKASPPREPLRDPEKAYPRIRDHFRGKSGIQGAYDQWNRVRRKLLAGEDVQLFDAKGKLGVN